MLLPGTVTQPLETVSAPQTLTISNIGSMPLAISGLTFVGSDPGDFFRRLRRLLGLDRDRRELFADCQISRRRRPAPGSAMLQIASNDPNGFASVTVSSTGSQRT